MCLFQVVSGRFYFIYDIRICLHTVYSLNIFQCEQQHPISGLLFFWTRSYLLDCINFRVYMHKYVSTQYIDMCDFTYKYLSKRHVLLLKFWYTYLKFNDSFLYVRIILYVVCTPVKWNFLIGSWVVQLKAGGKKVMSVS